MLVEIEIDRIENKGFHFLWNKKNNHKEVNMRKIGMIGLVAVFALTAMVTLSDAGPWKGWKGSGGWGYKSQYQRMYNQQSAVEIKGVVEAVEQLTPGRGMSYGIHLKVKTDTETVAVHLGPAWFIERQDISIEKGDIIEVKGSRITFNGAPALIAAKVEKGDVGLRLRDDNGFPVWAGSGMERMNRY
jgi:hypothetical protein